jgi:hypothetical protein
MLPETAEKGCESLFFPIKTAENSLKNSSFSGIFVFFEKTD